MNETLTREEVNTIISQFKEHLLTRMMEIESQIKNEHLLLKNATENKLKEYQASVERFQVRVEDVESTANKNKIKLDHIDGLLNFQKEATDKMVTQGVKINGIQKDLKDAVSKYDKIYLENLFIPGVIGEFCRFKNNREFVEFNLNNLTSLINFKEKCTGELKASNIKVDTMTKSITGQLDSLEKGVKMYSQKLVETCEENTRNEFNDVTRRIQEMKMDNHRYAMDLKNAATELKAEKDRLEGIRNEIYSQFDSTANKFKDMHKGTTDSFDKMKEEYDTIKKKFTDIAEFIKDVRFRKNLGVDVSRKEMKNIANAITYDSRFNSNPVHSSTDKLKKQRNSSTEIPIKREPSPEKEIDFSEENSVNINEKDEIESYVKKYITGGTTSNKKKPEPLKKSPELKSNQVIKETNEEHNVTDITPKNTKPRDEKSETTIVSQGFSSNAPTLEINSAASDKVRIPKTTKIEVETEKKDEKKTTQEKFHPSDVLDTNGNNVGNETKSNGFKKKKFKERFPTTKTNFTEKEKAELANRNKSPETITKFGASTTNMNYQNPSSNQALQVQNNNNLQIFHDKFSNLKKDLFKRFSLSEKRLNDLESSFKSAFEQLIGQIKSIIPIALNVNQQQSPKNRQVWNQSENMGNNYNQIMANNPYREPQNVVNNNTVSVNILDPTILFKNTDVEGGNAKGKRPANNVAAIKNNLQRKLMIENSNKEPSVQMPREDVVITRIRAKSSYGKKDKEL